MWLDVCFHVFFSLTCFYGISEREFSKYFWNWKNSELWPGIRTTRVIVFMSIATQKRIDAGWVANNLPNAG